MIPEEKQEKVDTCYHRITQSSAFGLCVVAFTLLPRLVYHMKLRKLLIALKKTARIQKKALETAKHYEDMEVVRLAQVGLYLCIIKKDMALLESRFVLAFNPEVKEVYAKQIALLVYEFISRQPDLFGKEFRDIVSALPNRSVIFKELASLGREVRKIKKSHESFLHEVRNSLVAHRDLNGEKQLSVIEKLNFKEIQSISKTIDSLLGGYINILTTVVQNHNDSFLKPEN